jgi:hemerythrin
MIVWTETYSVYIDEIDQQHKTLVAMINDLDTAMRAGIGKIVLEQTLANLVTYTQTHFAFEEQLLEAYQYPDLKQHQSEHEALTQSVLKLQSQYRENQVGLTASTSAFLSDWLSFHILGQDKKYGLYLKAKGVL